MKIPSINKNLIKLLKKIKSLKKRFYKSLKQIKNAKDRQIYEKTNLQIKMKSLLTNKRKSSKNRKFKLKTKNKKQNFKQPNNKTQGF